MKKINVAVLDDYQKIASDIGYFDKLKESCNIRFYNNIVTDEKLIEAISDCQIITLMRARSIINKPIIDRLPNLKL
ncbi:MAG: hypothetical protein K0S63_341, partial [Gammaproteobacteria bacterium]|nr:hypothetical protein [Gammaproteobacteria bacterium]